MQAGRQNLIPPLSDILSRAVKTLLRSPASPSVHRHWGGWQEHGSVDESRGCVDTDTRRTHLNGVWTDCKMTADQPIAFTSFAHGREGVARGLETGVHMADARIRDMDMSRPTHPFSDSLASYCPCAYVSYAICCRARAFMLARTVEYPLCWISGNY